MSEGDQNEGNALPEALEAKPQFRYGDLHFEAGANQETYDQYVKLATTLKQTHSKWAKQGIKEIKNKAK